ncbi:MAG: lysophospholipid acyltransferase family protein [Terriglobales bacterium]
MKTSSRFWDALSWVRSIFIFDPLIYVYTMVLGILSLLSSFFDRDGGIQHGYARLWSWLILHTALSPVKVTGLDRIDRSRPHVYAANHISALDIPLLYEHLPFQFRIMAKKELFRYPFMGWHLRRSGQIPVDASSAAASMRSLMKAVRSLQAGMPLVVFPEGGRSPNGQIQPFMSGAFYIAIKAGVDVVPMALVGTYEVLPMNSFHIRPGPMELVVGDPISTAEYGLRDMDTLAARVQKAIEDLYYSRSCVADPRRGEVTSG